jgi:hypothetical protein
VRYNTFGEDCYGLCSNDSTSLFFCVPHHVSKWAHNQPAFLSVAPRFVVQDLEHALAFYGQVGFVTTYRDEGFAIIERDGINLHLNASAEPPKSRSVCWIGVTNIEALTSSICQPMRCSLPWRPSPGGSKSFSFAISSEISSSLRNVSPKRMPVPNREDEREEPVDPGCYLVTG